MEEEIAQLRKRIEELESQVFLLTEMVMEINADKNERSRVLLFVPREAREAPLIPLPKVEHEEEEDNKFVIEEKEEK